MQVKAVMAKGLHYDLSGLIWKHVFQRWFWTKMSDRFSCSSGTITYCRWVSTVHKLKPVNRFTGIYEASNAFDRLENLEADFAKTRNPEQHGCLLSSKSVKWSTERLTKKDVSPRYANLQGAVILEDGNYSWDVLIVPQASLLWRCKR